MAWKEGNYLVQTYLVDLITNASLSLSSFDKKSVMHSGLKNETEDWTLVQIVALAVEIMVLNDW